MPIKPYEERFTEYTRKQRGLISRSFNGYGGEKAYQMAESQRRIAERKYRSALQRVINDIRKLVKGMTSPAQIIQAIDHYSRSAAFLNLAEEIAGNMVTAGLTGQRATWRAAAAESTRGKLIYQALKQETSSPIMSAAIDQILNRNYKLIKTVPPNVAKRLSRFAYEQQQKGIRPEDIAKVMQQGLPGMSASHVKLIARTESAKAASALMEARCDMLGLDWYIWRSCGDERVRDAHARMNGVLCRWSDPPNPEAMFGGHNSGGSYHHGGIYNCRCIAAPVIDLKDLSYPIRVHNHGRVKTVKSYGDLVKFVA